MIYKFKKGDLVVLPPNPLVGDIGNVLIEILIVYPVHNLYYYKFITHYDISYIGKTHEWSCFDIDREGSLLYSKKYHTIWAAING